MKRHYTAIAVVSGALMVGWACCCSRGSSRARRPARRAIHAGHVASVLGIGPMSSPPRPSLGQSVALVWRTLRSMRTALILLLMIGARLGGGSLLPQCRTRPSGWRSTRPTTRSGARSSTGRGLFDVFGSWWFVLLTTLLFVSLVACLFPRTRALVAGAAHAARAGPRDRRLPRYAERTVAARPRGRDRGRAPHAPRRRYRVALDPSRPALAAEKGIAREVGSLAFHWAFILLLVGVIVRQGHRVQRLDRGRGGPDVDRRRGQLRRHDPRRPVLRRLHGRRAAAAASSSSEFLQTGQPMDFVSRVDLLDADGDVAAAGRHPGEPPGEDRGALDLPVELRLGAGDRDRATTGTSCRRGPS